MTYGKTKRDCGGAGVRQEKAAADSDQPVVLDFYAADDAFVYPVSGVSDFIQYLLFHTGLVGDDIQRTVCRTGEF